MLGYVVFHHAFDFILRIYLAAVGFALDGTPEVVLSGETGFAVTPESVDEVVAATETLWNDPELRKKMGKNGQQLVLERFDWRRMADILLAEYRRLAKLKHA